LNVLNLGKIMKKRRSKKLVGQNAPARHLIEVSPHRTTGGLQVDQRTPYPAEYESAYEKLVIPRLLLCRDVKKVYSQQPRNYLDRVGKEHQYTADFLVERGDTETLIEVKPLEFLLHPEHLPKYFDIAKHFAKTKQPFAFIVDMQLFCEPQKSNTNLLMRYLTASLPSDALTRITEALRCYQLMSIAELCVAANCSLAEVYTLIAQRHLCSDWKDKLNKLSLVSLPDQPLKGLHLDDILRSSRHGDFLAALALGRGTPDQYQLENPTAWRQTRPPLTPWNYVGGIPKSVPLRALGETELSPRKSWERRDRAPGQATQPNND
jgi:hypothetical protein